MPITLTYNDILTLLLCFAVILLIVVLYHTVFVVVYLKKFAERLDYLSKEVEAIILKPLSAIDYGLEWLGGFIEGMREKQEAEAEEEKTAKKFKTHKVKAHEADETMEQ